MSHKPKASPAALPVIPAELLEQFGNGPMTAESINAVSLAFKKALIERALNGELSHHLGYAAGAAKPIAATNQRNGRDSKTVLTQDKPLRIDVPRDRSGSFEPLLIPKHERRFTGFDDKIIAMYARGMTVREIQAFLQEQYSGSSRNSRRRTVKPCWSYAPEKNCRPCWARKTNDRDHPPGTQARRFRCRSQQDLPVVRHSTTHGLLQAGEEYAQSAERFAESIKKMILEEPSFGYRTVEASWASTRTLCSGSFSSEVGRLKSGPSDSGQG